MEIPFEIDDEWEPFDEPEDLARFVEGSTEFGQQLSAEAQLAASSLGAIQMSGAQSLAEMITAARPMVIGVDGYPRSAWSFVTEVWAWFRGFATAMDDGEIVDAVIEHRAVPVVVAGSPATGHQSMQVDFNFERSTSTGIEVKFAGFGAKGGFKRTVYGKRGVSLKEVGDAGKLLTGRLLVPVLCETVLVRFSPNGERLPVIRYSPVSGPNGAIGFEVEETTPDERAALLVSRQMPLRGKQPGSEGERLEIDSTVSLAGKAGESVTAGLTIGATAKVDVSCSYEIADGDYELRWYGAPIAGAVIEAK